MDVIVSQHIFGFIAASEIDNYTHNVSDPRNNSYYHSFLFAGTRMPKLPMHAASESDNAVGPYSFQPTFIFPERTPIALADFRDKHYVQESVHSLCRFKKKTPISKFEDDAVAASSAPLPRA